MGKTFATSHFPGLRLVMSIDVRGLPICNLSDAMARVRGLVLHVPVYVYISYYYVTVLHLFGYSVNGHFSIRVRVRVWYYFMPVRGTVK